MEHDTEAGTLIDMTPTIGSLIELWKSASALADEQRAALKATQSGIDDIEAKIRHKLHESGQDSAKAHGVTVTVRQKWRAAYDPARWPELVRWCVANGYDHIVQRRLTDAKVMELVDNGVQLPEALRVESYPALEFRSK